MSSLTAPALSDDRSSTISCTRFACSVPEALIRCSSSQSVAEPEMAARVAAAVQARLAVVVATAEETLKANPNRVPRHVF
jgi:hypothetical protein